jgi:ribonucleoside-diphosphate reductase alpha chain
VQQAIRTHGIRNSHLLSIAPTGTVSLAFADNASNGIEPAFSWMYRARSARPMAARRNTRWKTTPGACTVSSAAMWTNCPTISSPRWTCRRRSHIAMMEAVQPFVDTAISKTVNVPAEYPYDDFKGLYLQAWRARLKGLATYRPNSILGSVLSETPAAPALAEQVKKSVANYIDPMRAVVEKRPKGALPAVAEKVEYWTQEGHQTVYLVVSFLPIHDDAGRVVSHRAIEFFMPVGQNSDSQQWNTASMRLLSLAARGGFLDRALTDMRKVAWDRGPVRLGHHTKEDGTRVPKWHESEVAAIAFAVQQIMAEQERRDAEAAASGQPVAEAALQSNRLNDGHTTAHSVMVGKLCSECGAHAVIRKDGCDYCTNCGHLGSCG